MIGVLGRGWRMFDDLPAQDRVVCTVFDYLGLGWLLLVPEVLFVSGAALWKMLLAIAFGVLCICVANYWTRIKPRLGPSLVASVTWVANNFWLKRILVLTAFGYLVVVVLSFSLQLRSDLDAYITPRTISEEQEAKLLDYLSKHDPYSVTVRVVPRDQEAANYAGQIFNVLRKTKWDVQGIEYPQIPAQKKPLPDDRALNGDQIYKTSADFIAAHDAWLDGEITRKINEQLYDGYGVFISIEEPGQPIRPDKLHPTPEMKLEDAAATLITGLGNAGVESGGGTSYNKPKDALSILVLHRPRNVAYQVPLRQKNNYLDYEVA